MNTILIQMADERWTLQALHLACAMARPDRAKIVLLRLMQVYQPSYLGSEFGTTVPSEQEYRNLRAFATIAEDYGVELSVESMQCLSPLQAVAEAAGYLQAEVVFASVPETRIPIWRKYQLWSLKRQLGANCRLYTLDQPVNDAYWAPAVSSEGKRAALGVK